MIYGLRPPRSIQSIQAKIYVENEGEMRTVQVRL